MEQSAPDGCAWVNIDARGCIYTKGSKNKTKRGTNARSGHVLQCMSETKKAEIQQGRSRMTRGDLGGEIEGN